MAGGMRAPFGPSTLDLKWPEWRRPSPSDHPCLQYNRHMAPCSIILDESPTHHPPAGGVASCSIIRHESPRTRAQVRNSGIPLRIYKCHHTSSWHTPWQEPAWGANCSEPRKSPRPRRGLNPRPQDLQSDALSTKLLRLLLSQFTTIVYIHIYIQLYSSNSSFQHFFGIVCFVFHKK